MKRHVWSLFFLVLVVETHRRFKRQAIPSQHIRIHSIDSKVNMDRFINVASTDSRIELLEKFINGTVWSANSKMQFDAFDSFVNASFNSEYFHIDIAQCELLYGNSLESLLFMTTNRTSDGHSFLTFSLYDNANMSLAEEGIEFQGINGRRIYVKSETWIRPVEKTITLAQNVDADTGESAVELTIVAPVHMTTVRFVGAELLIKYGPNVVTIDPLFQKVIVYNDRYSYCLDTKSPGSLRVTFGNGLIRILSGTSDFGVVVSPVDVTVNAHYLSKTQIDRGDGPIFISGVPIFETGVTVNCLLLTLQLNNNGMLHADANGAETLMKTSIQNVGLTTEHQEIRITGGLPGLVTESGDVRFEITKLSDPMAFTFLPIFTVPEDRFENIGPYSGTRYVPRIPPPLPLPVMIPPPIVLVPPPLPPLSPPPPPKPPILLPPDLMNFAADIVPVKKNLTTFTTTSTTTTTTTTTTPKPTTTESTTTTSPIREIPESSEEEDTGLNEQEKVRAKEKRRKEKMYREWESEENNVDNDGDTKEETFTYPNGTTVTRLINIRRKISTKIVYKHRVEEEDKDDDENNSTLISTTVKPNNSTIEPLIFPDPDFLNYTDLATDCKGNQISLNNSNPLETSTGYHLVTFPTVGGHVDTGSTSTINPITNPEVTTEGTTSSSSFSETSTIPDVSITTPEGSSEFSTVDPRFLTTTNTVVSGEPGASTDNDIITSTSAGETESTESSTGELSTIPTGLETSTRPVGGEASTVPSEEVSTVPSAEGISTTPVPSGESSTIPVGEETSTVPSETGSTVPSETSSTVPSETGSTVPSETGSTVPSETSSTVPSETGSTVPSETGSTVSTEIETSTLPSETGSTVPTETETSTISIEVTPTIPIEESTSIETITPTSPGEEFSTVPSEEVSTPPSDATTSGETPNSESSTLETTIITTTDGYPIPSQLSTDDFVIGHWFSTEEARQETTTEPSEIGITVSIGNVDLATKNPTGETDVPLPNDLNGNSETTTTPYFTTRLVDFLDTSTVETGNSIDEFPEPSHLPPTSTTPKSEKMLILKLQVPDEIDVNSSVFIKNITSSLRRLVRDVSTELKKRRKRSIANISQSDSDSVILDYDEQSIPIKVENITKAYDIATVTFAVQLDDQIPNEAAELENALHDVRTYDLHRYFAFEPVENISSYTSFLQSDNKTYETLIGIIIALMLVVVLVFLYLKKKGILEKVFRKFDRLRCNSLSSPPNVFSPN